MQPNGSGRFETTQLRDMIAYDQLPAEIRIALSLSPVSWSAEWVLEQFNAIGRDLDFALEQIDKMNLQWIQENRIVR